MDEKARKEKFLSWAKELQALSQNGLAYYNNDFDRMRYERIREISVEMMSHVTAMPRERVRDIFASETGYKTPKIDTRTAVFKDGKILLVKEREGGWSLPGGWADEGETVAQNAVKEVLEEAGMEVELTKLVAVLDRNKSAEKKWIQDITKIFFEADYLGGSFKENPETLDAEFFTLQEVKDLKLAESKTKMGQIEMCFEARKADNWKSLFE